MNVFECLNSRHVVCTARPIKFVSVGVYTCQHVDLPAASKSASYVCVRLVAISAHAHIPKKKEKKKKKETQARKDTKDSISAGEQGNANRANL